MPNKGVVFLVLFAGSLIACSGGGGSGGNSVEQLSASFQEGVPPEDISGTYEMTEAEITLNPCQIPLKTETPTTPIGETKIKFVQDGEKLGIANSGGNNVMWDGTKESEEFGISQTYSGKVSGDSFKIEIATTIYGDEGNPDCKVETKSVWVWTVTGDNFDSTLIGSMTATPNCSEKSKKYEGCSIGGTLVGVRIKGESSTPTEKGAILPRGVIDFEKLVEAFPIPIK